jgi:hypothetical protein
MVDTGVVHENETLSARGGEAHVAKDDDVDELEMRWCISLLNSTKLKEDVP